MQTKPFFVICQYSGVTAETCSSLVMTASLLAKKGMDFSLAMPSDSMLSRSREESAAFFLSATACTHLFFLDADIAFHPSAVVRMLEHDVDVVGGLYRKRVLDWQCLDLARDAGLQDVQQFVGPYASCLDTKSPITETGLVKAKRLATGFLCISRSALERVAEAYPWLEYKGQNGPVRAIFEPIIKPGSCHPGEDYSFCERCLEQGIELWCDLAIDLDHIGPHRFRSSFSSLLGKAKAMQEQSPPADATTLAN